MLIGKKRQNNKYQKGFSLLEIILALAIFSLIWASISSLSLGSFSATEQSIKYIQATELAREGIEGVKSVANTYWNQLVFATSSISNTNNFWEFTGENTTETINDFTRTISFSDVCRNFDKKIAECPADYTDIYSKKVNSNVSWNIDENRTNDVNLETIISNWNGTDWVQTNWQNGAGQNIFLDESSYQSDNGNINIDNVGQISLKDGKIKDSGFDSVLGPSNFDWDFTNAGDYVFDSNLIEFTSGLAQLKSIGTGNTTISGSTTNPFFDISASPWTYSDWENPNRINGTYSATGGNTGGNVNLLIDHRKNNTVSGYWQQSFVTTVTNPDTATVNLDYIVRQFVPNYTTSFQVYVFVDNVAGNPVLGQQVWTSPNITGTTGWINSPTINVTSKLTTAGTYYLKIAVRVIHGNGTGNVLGQHIISFDNAQLNYSKIISSGTGYSTSSPSIYPNDSFITTGSGSWSSFIETANKNGGEIYYQLSDDDGLNWYYYNGNNWIVAGPSDYNTALDINSNINTFNSSTNKIKFKAFLSSDGSQQVQLDNVNIVFSPNASQWAFSNWDVNPGEVTPTGNTDSLSGNPTGYVDINIPAGSKDSVGGYWYQMFTSYKDNPTGANLSFDYKVFDYTGTPTSLILYVYIDNNSGIPTNQAYSLNLNSTTGWNTAGPINVSSLLNTAGDYYIKLGLFVVTPNGPNQGPFNVGFDNVYLDLGTGTYAQNGILTSSAFDMTKISSVPIIEWDQIVPSINESIRFQVRTAPDNSGNPGSWTPYYGTSGSGTYFNNSSGNLIPSQVNGNQWVQYRVELIGDGSDTPLLNEVRINYQ